MSKMSTSKRKQGTRVGAPFLSMSSKSRTGNVEADPTAPEEDWGEKLNLHPEAERGTDASLDEEAADEAVPARSDLKSNEHEGQSEEEEEDFSSSSEGEEDESWNSGSEESSEGDEGSDHSSDLEALDDDEDDELDKKMRNLIMRLRAGKSDGSNGVVSDDMSGGSETSEDDDAEEEELGEEENSESGKLSVLPGVSERAKGSVVNGNGEEVQTVEESDSEDDGELNPRNTIGDVPLAWYRDEKHIGYDIHGEKITKKDRKDQLDAFLERADNAGDWRKLYDEYNDEEVILTKDEVNIIRALRHGRTPHAGVNPHEESSDWFEWEDKGHPLSSAPEPKRRFVPSKWEAKKVVKFVRALRKGWISLDAPKEKPKYYMLWGDDTKSANRTANGLAYIPAPKPKLPGHDESYNPPEEYIPTQEEINAYQLMYEEDRPKFIPSKFDAMRNIPAYDNFIRERFERCLDLYLCPRTKKKRMNIDPESLVPKLPTPKDLRPFPTTLALEYRGHSGAVSCLSVCPTGAWLASGSLDGSVRVWEVENGSCRQVWKLDSAIRKIAWNPNPQISILAVVVENDLVLLNTGVGPEEDEDKLSSFLTVDKTGQSDAEEGSLTKWSQHEIFKGLKLRHQHAVHSVSWHYKGDYIVTVAPDDLRNSRSVLVHQLSRQRTQNPFRKYHGRVVRVLFHPSRPFMFVATKINVRIYNLVKQTLSKKLVTGLREISDIAVHPGGDNVIVGSKEAKLAWFDMDLSTKPYKMLRNHASDIKSVAFHRTYPLFATCSEDSTAHVFHGMVYSDLLQNPLIVPVKVLRGHEKGVHACEFHPTEPWLFTGGGDEVIRLFVN